MPDSSVPEVVHDRIVGGARVVFVGGVLAALFTVAGRTVIARAFSPETYGAFAIGLTVMFLAGVFGYGAFSRGISRQVSFTLETDDPVPDVFASWGMLLVAGSTLLLAGAVVAAAGPLAREVFHDPTYEPAIRLVALGLPFFGCVYGLASVLRGHGRATGRVLFYDVARTATFPLVVVGAAAAFGPDPTVVYAAFPVSLALTALAFGVYVWRSSVTFATSPSRLLAHTDKLVRLVRFSLPLLFSGVFLKLMTRADTFMVGLFMPPTAVGQYAVVRPLLRPMTVVWMSMIWMYTPLVSSLTAKVEMERLQRVYLAMTKWFCLFTFPLAVTVALFPEPVLVAVFGPEYAPAAVALRLVAAGYFLGNFFGPTGATLTGLGYTKVLLAANGLAAVVNVALNAALIPHFGLAGAALGTVTAQGTRNLARLAVLYRTNGIHALYPEFYVPTLLAAAALTALRQVVVAVTTPTVAVVVPFALVAFLTYVLLYPVTGSVNDDDREMASRLLPARWTGA